jgi:hypothetical protein
VLRQEAAKSRSDAQALRERAVVYDEQATRLGMNADDLAARKAAIGATQVEVLDVHLRKLGKAWESQADTLLTKKTSELRVAQAGITTREQAVKVAEYRASDADLRAAAATAACEAALAALESSDPDALMLSLEDGLASLQLQDAEVHGALDALGAEASVAVEKAKRALDEARQRAQAAKGTHGHAAAALDVARAAVNGRIGELGALRAQLQARDRAGASAVLEQRRAELTAMPIEPGATDADIAAAERAVAEANRELEEAKEELHKSEGALSKVGGAAIREEVDRVQEALNVAGVRERALEIDADAWKLLRDTLRDVENEEGAHLGRALAGPVATKFIELTGGRYRDLRLDAALKTEAVQVAGGSGDADVLRALSVGTRGQLATLIRLTIADQLKSAIVLDDHLVHTDPKRLTWFRDMLTKTAVNTQVIVITCRPQDYLSPSELTDGAPIRDLAGGTMRAIDAGRVVKRYASAPSRPPPDAEAGIKVRA